MDVIGSEVVTWRSSLGVFMLGLAVAVVGDCSRAREFAGENGVRYSASDLRRDSVFRAGCGFCRTGEANGYIIIAAWGSTLPRHNQI